MHHTTIKLRASEAICTGGPWWFIQLWLTIYFTKGQGINLPACTFPNDYTEGEEESQRQCESYGEASSSVTCCSLSAPETSQLFRLFLLQLWRECYNLVCLCTY